MPGDAPMAQAGQHFHCHTMRKLLCHGVKHGSVVTDQPLEPELNAPAAALREIRPQGVVAQRNCGGCRVFVQQRPPGLHGAPFELAAADTAELPFAREQHAAACLARTGAIESQHGHAHNGLT